MPFTTDQIYNEAMLLPNDSKILLVEKLLEKIGDNIDRDVAALQIQEAKIRRDDIRSGKVKPVPGEDALRQVRDMVGEI